MTIFENPQMSSLFMISGATGNVKSPLNPLFLTLAPPEVNFETNPTSFSANVLFGHSQPQKSTMLKKRVSNNVENQQTFIII